VGVVVVVLAAIAAACVFAQWWINRPDSSNELPPLIMREPPGSGEAFPSWPIREQAEPAPEPPARAAAKPEPVLRPQPTVPDQPAPLYVVRDYIDDDEPVSTETIRFRRPGDEAVQLLPGRLEVVSGDPRHQEIRFVRVPGRRAEVILGREPGDSPQHVALESSTVSRQHARLAFANGQWLVSNLSQTNPVVVNDQELSSRDGSRLLVDGDRLELGEVLLRFHAR
jgi:hypothetical protein